MFHALSEILAHKINLPAERIEPEATQEDIDLDSLAIVELSVALEEDFGVRISEEELRDAPTIGDIARLVEQRRATTTA